MHKRIITKNYLAEMIICLILTKALVYMVNMLSQVLASATCGRDAFHRLENFGTVVKVGDLTDENETPEFDGLIVADGGDMGETRNFRHVSLTPNFDVNGYLGFNNWSWGRQRIVEV